MLDDTFNYAIFAFHQNKYFLKCSFCGLKNCGRGWDVSLALDCFQFFC